MVHFRAVALRLTTKALIIQYLGGEKRTTRVVTYHSSFWQLIDAAVPVSL